jgi:hypothetical protein
MAAVQELGALAVQERKLLTQDIDGLAVKAVDRAFLRAAQLSAAVLIAVFLAIIVLLIVARRVFFGPRHSGDDPRTQSSSGPAI